MERYYKNSHSIKENLNETYLHLEAEDFKNACIYLYKQKHAILRVMFASDERTINGAFAIYAAYTIPGTDRLYVPYMTLKSGRHEFPSITPQVPSAHWYEREIKDMLGLTPRGHPDTRRLMLHDSFPKDSHPLRKDWDISVQELTEWGGGVIKKVPHEFMQVDGEGVCEIPVGPVHAGIIEPGHFRFSTVGETILFLEPRLFYKHKGIEKQFERLGFNQGVALAERVSGTSSFSHSSAYCMAVERMAGITISEKAMASRLILLELERLYNHIGDIGNICAGTGLAVGYAKGALLKETLMALNQRITHSRYLRGVNAIGGITRDVLAHADDILRTLDETISCYKSMMTLLTQTVSHVERLENTGRLSKDIAVKLGATGITARASGITDDIRKSHPHLLYDKLSFEPHYTQRGDVYGRMMCRAEEAECSISLVQEILETPYKGDLTVQCQIRPLSSAFGYTESPRGSVFYFVKSGADGTPLRVKLRSPSYCNWPVVPFAVHGNIVPDFPLCNKSFNLSYSGCDM